MSASQLMDILLAGPRGRRLLLEYALESEREHLANQNRMSFNEAVMLASYRLDLGAGTSVVLFGPGADEARQTVVTADSAAVALRDLPLKVSASRRHDWYRVTGRDGRWVVPDWAAVARQYDAVRLPITAYLAHAGTAINVDDDTASVIAGWSPDETY